MKIALAIPAPNKEQNVSQQLIIVNSLTAAHQD